MASFPLTKEAFDFVAETSLKLKNADVENFFTGINCIVITFSFLFIWVFYEMFLNLNIPFLSIFSNGYLLGFFLFFFFLIAGLIGNICWASYSLHLSKNTQIVVEELNEDESQALETINPNAGPLDFYKSFYTDSDAAKLRNNQIKGTIALAICLSCIILLVVVVATYKPYESDGELNFWKKFRPSCYNFIVTNLLSRNGMYYFYIIAYLVILSIASNSKNYFTPDLKF